MHAMILFAALSATSPETTFTERETPATAATSETLVTASATWSWSGIFHWAQELRGFVFEIR